MSLKRNIIESIVWSAGRLGPNRRTRPENPSSIFILRNNDIGDLLVTTPLFEALKRLFPKARIIAGIGRWNYDVLQNNPWVDQIAPMDAPWNNKQVCQRPHNSVRGFLTSLNFILRSDDVRQLRKLRCDIGIDPFGCPEASLLMVRAGIPWRMGVKGYVGGHSACHQLACKETHVGRTALEFAEMLGGERFPSNRPQLFLTEAEKQTATATWKNLEGPDAGNSRRILIAPGGGLMEKCWPRESYRELVGRLAARPQNKIIILGSNKEVELGEYVKGDAPNVLNFCGKSSLREAFGLTWAADAAICNSSMLMHVAAAFDKPSVVFLGHSFHSARGHKQYWGYGENDLLLGREPERDRIYTVEEAMPLVNAHLKLDHV